MILRFEKVTYAYPGMKKPALEEFDLEIRPGESVLVSGASGSGKSTFCRATIGLVPHFYGGTFTGIVQVDGLQTIHHPVHELFRHAGLVFQNPDAQLFNRTVEAELAYGLESLGVGASEIGKRLAWASQLVGLDHLMDRPPWTLSGGEKQRVALGSILTLRPRLLLLDEPFTHLDPEAAEGLRETLRAMTSEGITTIIVEHRLQEIIEDVNRIIVLCEGRVALDGPPRQVVSDDLVSYGLNLPPSVKLFKEFGISAPLFDVEEGWEALRRENLIGPFTRYLAERLPRPSSKPNRSAPPVVEMEDVWFSPNGLPLLQGIDLTLRKGECVALLGRNGAGKTTLIKHLNGLIKPQKGAVRILGKDSRKCPVSELARHVGLVWQNPNDQIFRPTVREEVLTGSKMFQIDDPLWIDQLFERFGLIPLLDRSPFGLSEGEKKRVSMAAALSTRPALLVLDEPTAGQDDPSRRQLTSLLRELQEEGQTLLFATHDLEFAAEHAERWIILSEGKIVADGGPREVMADSRRLERAGLRATRWFRLIQATPPRREDHL